MDRPELVQARQSKSKANGTRDESVCWTLAKKENGMRKIMTVSAALFGAAILPASNASAHSQEEVHDMLHGQGYDRVEYQSQYRDDEGKPVYRFSACEGRRAINLDVNWYGNIIDRDRAGFCDRGGEYGYRDRDRDGDGDRYRDRD